MRRCGPTRPAAAAVADGSALDGRSADGEADKRMGPAGTVTSLLIGDVTEKRMAEGSMDSTGGKE